MRACDDNDGGQTDEYVTVVYNVTHRMRPFKKKVNIVYLNSGVLSRGL